MSHTPKLIALCSVSCVASVYSKRPKEKRVKAFIPPIKKKGGRVGRGPRLHSRSGVTRKHVWHRGLQPRPGAKISPLRSASPTF